MNHCVRGVIAVYVRTEPRWQPLAKKASSSRIPPQSADFGGDVGGTPGGGGGPGSTSQPILISPPWTSSRSAGSGSGSAVSWATTGFPFRRRTGALYPQGCIALTTSLSLTELPVKSTHRSCGFRINTFGALYPQGCIALTTSL